MPQSSAWHSACVFRRPTSWGWESVQGQSCVSSTHCPSSDIRASSASLESYSQWEFVVRDTSSRHSGFLPAYDSAPCFGRNRMPTVEAWGSVPSSRAPGRWCRRRFRHTWNNSPHSVPGSGKRVPAEYPWILKWSSCPNIRHSLSRATWNKENRWTCSRSACGAWSCGGWICRPSLVLLRRWVRLYPIGKSPLLDRRECRHHSYRQKRCRSPCLSAARCRRWYGNWCLRLPDWQELSI